jgi:hypothetical protein
MCHGQEYGAARLDPVFAAGQQALALFDQRPLQDQSRGDLGVERPRSIMSFEVIESFKNLFAFSQRLFDAACLRS